MIRRGGSWLVILVLFLTTKISSSFTSENSRSLVGSERTDLFELSVIHLNDFHARFVQTGPTMGFCHKEEEDQCLGGFARVYTATKQLLRERPNSIFLNAGDNFQGTLYYNLHGWNITGTFMNMLPHDAMTIGNHEFDNRIAGLVPFLEMVCSPVVVTNIDASLEPTLKGLYQNSTIIERNGTRIGVIGVILSTTNTFASTENLIFLDEVETVNDEAERLKAQGVEVIIFLSHCGLPTDRILAANCPNVDVIVGGHSHSFLYTGTPPDSNTPVEDEYPVVVVQESGNRTVLVVQAYAFTKYLGNLSVWFDTSGEVVGWEGNPILLDHSWEEDLEILAALAPWQVDVDNLGLQVVGSTKVRLLNNYCSCEECNIGNLITDAMVDSWVKYAENSTYWTYAAIACFNAGGIRTTIEAGVITYSDLVMNQPFENTWDVVELKGSDLLKVLEESVSTSNSKKYFSSAAFLQWSGIRVNYNLTNPVYSRVTGLKIRCRACEIPVYDDVKLDEWYRIVTIPFLIEGGDGHWTLATAYRNHRVGTVDIDQYVSYVRKKSPITLGLEGRQILGGTWSG